ncbi:MAG: 4-hydroxy-3-methylbut-2-enyl diphosphate reductase [candidate division FCPU426 bacterium]
MEIRLAKHAGHCFGVKAAIQTAFKTARREKQPIYTLGPIIHNPQVVDKLRSEGVAPVNNLSEIGKGVIIIRSHGVAPQVLTEARERGLKVVDATCPFVKRAQNQAQELVKQGYALVILGDMSHPEVEGILGTVNGEAAVVSDGRSAAQLPMKSRYGLIAQTTQSLENLQEVACSLLTRAVELKVINTICNATTQLQQETRELAGEVDVMLVVGGRNSANTSRLASICQETGVRHYHIETASEIQPGWFEGVSRVGVTAGTSTPEWVIADVMERLHQVEGSGGS